MPSVTRVAKLVQAFRAGGIQQHHQINRDIRAGERRVESFSLLHTKRFLT